MLLLPNTTFLCNVANLRHKDPQRCIVKIIGDSLVSYYNLIASNVHNFLVLEPAISTRWYVNMIPLLNNRYVLCAQAANEVELQLEGNLSGIGCTRYLSTFLCKRCSSSA